MEQLRQFTNLSSWKEDDYSIESGELKTIDFIDTAPNTFILQNPNNCNLLVSIGGIPTINNYETKIETNSVKTFGRPTSTRKLYILNNGTRTAKIKLFSIFMQDFDINTLKYTEIDIANATIQSNSFISGFSSSASLPSGTNTIGKVELGNNVSNTLTQIKSSLDEQKENTVNVLLGQSSIIKVMMYITYGLGINPLGDFVYKNNVSSLTINNSGTSPKIVHFSYLFNDNCDVDIKVNGETKLTILSGEQVGDLEFEIPSNQSLTIVKGATATAQETVNIRCKYFTYSYNQGV